jgi:hypothetical protein
MKTIIHVNQHVIKANQKTGERNPVLTCKTYKTTMYGHTAEINGKVRIVYRPDKPLSCGATVWIETEDEVIVEGEVPEPEQKQLVKVVFTRELAAKVFANKTKGCLLSEGTPLSNGMMTVFMATQLLKEEYSEEGKSLDGDSNKDLQLYVWR